MQRMKKRGKDLSKLKEILYFLTEEKPLAIKLRDHVLVGNYVGRRECHIEPNWLLIYKKDCDTIILERTGTHSDLFKS
jgi:mRNA interferase YafQ